MINNDIQRQLFANLEKSILSYINCKNSLYFENFFDISDCEERIAFLSKMYDQYSNIDGNVKEKISKYIAKTIIETEKQLALHKQQMNDPKFALGRFLIQKMNESNLSTAQCDIIYKNFLYIQILLKSQLMLDKNIKDKPLTMSDDMSNKLQETTFPEIWHKIQRALQASNGNVINFRNKIIEEIKSLDEDNKKECENARNNFLNLQGDVIIKLSEYERFITGRQNQPVKDNNLDAIGKKLNIEK